MSKVIKAAYCVQYADDGMVDVVNRRCSYDSCGIIPSFNVVGRKTAGFCKKQAEDGMVNSSVGRCSHESCTDKPGFDVVSDKICLLYTSPSPRDGLLSRMPSSA